MPSTLRERTQGRWRGILPVLGIPPEFLNGKHQPCPMCGGKDRARFDDKEGRGTWICTRCGAGDGFSLVMAVNGWNFRVAATHVEALIGTADRVEPKPAITEQDRRASFNRLWQSSKLVEPGDPVALWLGARVRVREIPPCLRTVSRMRYQADPPSWHPGMVAMVTGPDGKPATLHRTYLTAEGRKAEIEEPRLLMPGPFPKGGAIRLAPHHDILGIAEGIETAFAASALFSIPCWAAGNDSGVAAWIPPEEVAEVIIFADNDENFAGQAAAHRLAHRLSVKNRIVALKCRR
jgi:putative DNA primase/helicase